MAKSFRLWTVDEIRPSGEAAARDLHANRYHPAHVLYERLADPEANRDAIVDNDDLARPILRVRPGGRLCGTG